MTIMKRIRARTHQAGSSDAGQITLLAIGFMVIALALIFVVVSVTAIQLDRNRLWNTADDAARFAANAIDFDAFYVDPDPNLDGVPITDASVQQAVTEYLALASQPSGSLHQVRITQAHTPDGRTATVTLEGVSQPAMLGWFLRTFSQSDGVAIRVHSSARAW